MRAGEEGIAHCPNDLDIGGGIQNNWHSTYGFTWLDHKIDTRYHIAISECSLNPVSFHHEFEMETLSAGFPMYLLSHHKDSEGNRMTLTSSYEDQYAPRSTGVHNVHLEVWKGKENPALNQQWVWNADDTSLVNVGTGSALFEGFNKNIIVYKWKGLANQRFKYNVATKRIENRMTGFALDVKNDII